MQIALEGALCRDDSEISSKFMLVSALRDLTKAAPDLT